MKHSYTPGPWANQGYGLREPGNLMSEITTADNKIRIARVDSHSIFFDGSPTQEAVANAYLIAAAPELLEALQCMYEMYEALAKQNGTLDDSVMFEARQAIAKAKGR